MNIIKRAVGWMAQKAIQATGGASWYVENGYFKLAESHGAGISTGRALRNTAVFGCVKIISEDVGALPLFLYRRGADDARTLAFDEPLYRVLHDTPNPQMTAIDLRGAMTAHAALTGDGYARIARRGSDGKVIGLFLLQPNEVTVAKNNSGALVYINRPAGGNEKTYGQRDILHLRGFGWSGTTGLNIVKEFGEAIGLGLAAERYATNFFLHDATPGIALKNQKSLNAQEVQLMREAFIAAHKQHGVAVLHAGVELEQFGADPEKSQLTSQRTFQLLEICRIFRVPPHKLAELSRATFSNIEQQNIDYYTQTIKPWLVRWEQAIGRCCIDQADLYAEHTIEGLLKGDFQTQTNGFRSMLAAGVYSINEVRALYNLNPIEGGDVHFIQINMGDIESVAAGNTDQQPLQPPTEPMKRGGIFRVRELLG